MALFMLQQSVIGHKALNKEIRFIICNGCQQPKEYWSIGVLEYWSIGVLEYWSINYGSNITTHTEAA